MSSKKDRNLRRTGGDVEAGTDDDTPYGDGVSHDDSNGGAQPSNEPYGNGIESNHTGTALSAEAAAVSV